jgi:hypothetical protein
MSAETFFGAVVGQFINADKKRIGSFGYFECIADMVPVPMGQNYKIGFNFR